MVDRWCGGSRSSGIGGGSDDCGVATGRAAVGAADPAGWFAGGGSGQVVPRGVVQHGELTPSPEELGGLVHHYNGERVRLAGFVVPLDFSETRVQEFLLVPYIGACIHVPPPPPNQIVYVRSEEGIEVAGMFEAVWVTGTFNTAAISNELADIGYRIEAESVEPYEQ